MAVVNYYYEWMRVCLRLRYVVYITNEALNFTKYTDKRIVLLLLLLLSSVLCAKKMTFWTIISAIKRMSSKCAIIF